MKLFRVFQSHYAVSTMGGQVCQKVCERLIEASDFTELAQQLGGELKKVNNEQRICFSAQKLPPNAIITSRVTGEKFWAKTVYTLEIQIGNKKLFFEMDDESRGSIEVEEVEVIRIKEKSIAA